MKSARLAVAESIARLAGSASRIFLGKSGETITGRIVLGLFPNSIDVLAADKAVVLVSATNGKTSTTKSLTQIKKYYKVEIIMDLNIKLKILNI